jgi:hypothetical protein
MDHVTRFLVLAVILALFAGEASASPPYQEDTGREYTVQTGDCLATIAESLLGSQRLWPAVWQATNDRAMTDSRFTHIQDPHLIHSGQLLWLPSASKAEAMLSEDKYEPSSTATSPTTGILAADVVYVGQWYRETFHYSKTAPNIRHFVLVVPALQYQLNPHIPGHICSQIRFPAEGEMPQFRDADREVVWDLSVLHTAPYEANLEPGQYYVGACFIAAPLSRQEAGVGEDAILYAGITGGGASSEYQMVTVEAGQRRTIVITLTDKHGWACPWVYVHNGRVFERHSEILRNLNSKAKEGTQRQSLGQVPVHAGIIRLQIREEKPETTYLDALHLEVNGLTIQLHPETAEAPILNTVDGDYLVLRKGDTYELKFDVSTVISDSTEVETIIVSTGYYASEF